MKKERIPTKIIKEIVSNEGIDLLTRALIIAQYSCGCRIGELLPYRHKTLKKGARTKKKIFEKKERKDYAWQPEDFEEWISEGLKRKHITENGKSVSIVLTNFKNRQQLDKVGFILLKYENWLYKPFKKYITNLDEETVLFKFSDRWAQKLVGKALKRYNPKWSSHHLRHSRATNLIVDLNIPIERVKLILGHASLDSTMVYTHLKIQDAIDSAIDGYIKKEEREKHEE